MSDNFTVRVNVKGDSKDPKNPNTQSGPSLKDELQPLLDASKQAMDDLEEKIDKRKREIRDEMKNATPSPSGELVGGALSMAKGGAAFALGFLGVKFGASLIETVKEGMVQLVHNVSEMAEDLTDYSPALSQQKAIAELKKIQQSVELSQKYDQELTDYMTSQTDLDIALRELKATFSALIAPLLTKIANGTTKLIELITYVVSQIEEFLIYLGLIAKNTKPSDKPGPMEDAINAWLNVPLR